jgi:hypothetical protein
VARAYNVDPAAIYPLRRAGLGGRMTDLKLFEDKASPGAWRVEYFDDDGGCYVTVFGGPQAEDRARDYYAALRTGLLASHAIK